MEGEKLCITKYLMVEIDFHQPCEVTKMLINPWMALQL